MVIDGEVEDHQQTAIEDFPTVCDPDCDKNDDEDFSAEGAMAIDVVVVEDLAAVELETLKPRRGQFSAAWKYFKNAALRLLYDAETTFEQKLPPNHPFRRRHLAGRR